MLLDEPDKSGLIRAIAAKMNLGRDVIDIYMLPDGQKRVSSESIGNILGYNERWFYTRSKRQSKWLKGLYSLGFTGDQIDLKVIRQRQDGEFINTGSVAKSISLRDFIKLIAYEAIGQRNLNAIILLAAFAEVGFERTVEDLFAGRSIEFLLEKIVHYSKWTYEELEQALADNREDLRALYAWGFPPSLVQEIRFQGIA